MRVLCSMLLRCLMMRLSMVGIRRRSFMKSIRRIPIRRLIILSKLSLVVMLMMLSVVLVLLSWLVIGRICSLDGVAMLLTSLVIINTLCCQSAGRRGADELPFPAITKATIADEVAHGSRSWERSGHLAEGEKIPVALDSTGICDTEGGTFSLLFPR